MNEQQDVYKAPETPDVLASGMQEVGPQYNYDGKDLWVRNGCQLPERCIFTNKTSEEAGGLVSKTQKLAWSSPWWLFLLLTNLLIYLIVVLAVQKRATVQFFMSVESQKKRRIKSFLAIFFLLVSIGLLIGGGVLMIQDESDLSALLLVVGVFSTLGSLVAVSIVSRYFRATKEKNGWFRIKGCRPEFVASLAASVTSPTLPPQSS